MRQHQLSERGSANWPFIITLILLLVFAYMWFDERDQREVAQVQSAEAEVKADAAKQAATAFVNYANELSRRVGWNTEKDAKSLILPPTAADPIERKAEEEAAAIGKQLARDLSITDLAKLDANLSKDGTIDGEPGLLNFLINDAEAEILKDIRHASGDAVSETPAVFEWMTPEFKAKLIEIDAMEVPTKPKPAIDPDDAADVARYESELAAYEEAMKAYTQAIDELQAMDGYKEFDAVIKGPRLFNPDERGLLKLDFFTQSLTSSVDVETLLTYPPMVVKAIIGELKANKDADAAIIDQVRADSAAKAGTIDQLQDDLRQEQERHTADVQQLNGELATANETAESNRLEATQALQRVQVVEEEMRREVASRESRIGALENRIRIDKEDRDLKIRRDAKDGNILTASPTMGTAIIDLGSKHKIYPGLKFNVSYIGKGGLRLPKGQVQVTRILGRNSAKVAILGEDPSRPISQGDFIHNPLWAATDTIHVYLAGELERYPIEIAKERLARMGVVLDSKVDGDTDYVVVPNAMAAPAPEAGDEDEDEENVGAKTAFEQIQALARTFGATVITEKMLNEFLNY